MKTKRKINKRHLFIFLPILIIVSALLAPFLWKAINALIIEPAVYYWWRVRRLIQFAPQSFYWYFWIGGMGLVTIITLLRYFRKRGRGNLLTFVREGQLSTLARSISRAEKSHYTKWLLANRLATISLNLIKHGSGPSQTITYKFPEDGWSPPEIIKNYLDAGLDNSHMSLRAKRGWFKPKETSPLDADLNQVIEFIESQMEKS